MNVVNPGRRFVLPLFNFSQLLPNLFNNLILCCSFALLFFRLLIWHTQGPFGVAGAIAAFKAQFKSKAGAAWEQRHTMTAKPGKYMWLERDYNDDEEDKDGGDSKGKGKAKDDEVKEEEKEPEILAPPEIQVCPFKILVAASCDFLTMRRTLSFAWIQFRA